jgi:hypothetical protein
MANVGQWGLVSTAGVFPHRLGPRSMSMEPQSVVEMPLKVYVLVQGGAISYAAAVLSALGVRSCVVTGVLCFVCIAPAPLNPVMGQRWVQSVFVTSAHGSSSKAGPSFFIVPHLL